MTMMSLSTAEDRWHPDHSCGWHCHRPWWWEEGKQWCWASLLCKWVGKRELEEALLALMMTVMTSVRATTDWLDGTDWDVCDDECVCNYWLAWWNWLRCLWWWVCVQLLIGLMEVMMTVMMSVCATTDWLDGTDWDVCDDACNSRHWWLWGDPAEKVVT